MESLVESEPACVVVALSRRRAGPRSAWGEALPDDLRAQRCAAAFAIDRDRFAACAALAWEREHGCRAVMDGDLLTLSRGGEPLRARVVRAVTVTPDAMVVFDPAMPPDDVDPLLTLAAARCAATARMLVSRDARVDALPLGRYLAVDPAER